MAEPSESEAADHVPAELGKLTEAEERYLAGEPMVVENNPPPRADAEPENVVANDEDTLSEDGKEGEIPEPAPEPAPAPAPNHRRTLLQLVEEVAESLGYQDLDALLSEPKGRGTINPYIPKFNVFVPEMRMWISPVRIAPQKATTYVMAPRNKSPFNNTELSLDAIYSVRAMTLRQPQLNLVYCGIWGNWPLERLFVGQNAKLEKKARQDSLNQPVRDQPSTSGIQPSAPHAAPTTVRCHNCGHRVPLPRSA